MPGRSVLHRHSARAARVNVLMKEGDERVRATYGENYPRVRAIKQRDDPTNPFRVNRHLTLYE